jgi:hypothetical protein
MEKQLNTVKELIYWSYANLAMAHSAINQHSAKYTRINYIIRAKLYKGLITGTMNIGSLIDDEKVKLKSGCICAYCGTVDNLSIDHLVPKMLGGENNADNALFACRSCNSSKGSKDLLEWYGQKEMFPPILILRRYLKLVYKYCCQNNLLEAEIESICKEKLPFRLDLIPASYPEPTLLRL